LCGLHGVLAEDLRGRERRQRVLQQVDPLQQRRLERPRLGPVQHDHHRGLCQSTRGSKGPAKQVAKGRVTLKLPDPDPTQALCFVSFVVEN